MATKAPAKPAAKAAPKKTGTAVATVKKNAGAVVDIKAAMAKEIASISERTAPAGGDKISVKNKKFTLPNGDSSDELRCVIVDFTSYNAFYEGAFNKDDIKPPTCFALGTIPSQMVPSDNAPVKQSDECQSCPMNAFGSDGKGKACKNHRRLALLPPDGDESDAFMVLDVSPTGIKSFDAYVKGVAAKFNMPPVGVITTITFDPASDYPSLRFVTPPEPNENLAEHYARKQEAMERISEEPDVSGYTAAAPAKGRTAPVKGRR